MKGKWLGSNIIKIRSAQFFVKEPGLELLRDMTIFKFKMYAECMVEISFQS